MKIEKMTLRMTLHEARMLAALAGYPVEREEELPDGNGIQLRLGMGNFLNVYHSGVVVAQGRNAGPVREAIKKEIAARTPSLEGLFV